MHKFYFKASDRSGNPVEGTITAETEEYATGALRVAGYRIEYLAMRSLFQRMYDGMEYFVLEKLAAAYLRELLNRYRQVPPKFIAFFMRQLSVLYDAGITLKRSLEIMKHEKWPGPLAAAIEQIDNGMNIGMPFYRTLEQFPAVFNRTLTSIVTVGETSGKMSFALEKAADLTEENANRLNRITSVLVYPLFIVIGSLFFMGLMISSIYPMMEKLIIAHHIKTSWVIDLFFDTVRFLKSPFMLIVLLEVLLLLLLFYRIWSRSEKNRLRLDRLLLKIPGLGKFLLATSLSRCAYHMWMLLDSGVTVMEALEVLSTSAGNQQIAKAVQKAKERVMDGDSLSDALGDEPLFGRVFINFLRTGEETGTVSKSLFYVAQFYEQETEQTLAAYLRLFEPFAIIIMGLLVGGVMLSFLPLIYQISRGIGG